MKLMSVLSILTVHLLLAGPAMGARDCRGVFTEGVSTATLDWNQAAAGFMAALDKRQTAVFPAEVSGQSLIPAEILTSLGYERGNAKDIDKIESVSLEKNPEGFEIILRYSQDGEARTRTLRTSSNRFFVWRNYLRKVLKGKGEALAFDLEHLPAPKPFDAKAYSENLVKTNNFNTGRTMTEYKQYFGGRLQKILKGLQSSDQTWIDMGAGSAFAQRTFLKARLEQGPLAEVPHLRAVSYKIPGPPEAIHKIEDQHPGVFKYIEGKQTPTSLRRMEPADLITDVVGIATYFENSLAIVTAYVDLLKPGGKLLISPFKEDYLQLPESAMRKIESLEVIEAGDNGRALLIIRKP